MQRQTLRWRNAALVLAGPAVLAACGSSSQVARNPTTPPARLAPPVITERFTPLPCPRNRAARQTTIGIEGCAERHILRADAEIGTRERAIFRRLDDRLAKERFVRAERAWLVYRQATCASVADTYRGGSAEPIIFAECLGARNREHLRELASFQAFVSRR